MNEQDTFERDLELAMRPGAAPSELRRKIADIPLTNLRPAAQRAIGQSWWQRLHAAMVAPSMVKPWAAGFSAALASLAIGFWIGATGLASLDDAPQQPDELASLAFPGAGLMGDEP